MGLVTSLLPMCCFMFWPGGTTTYFIKSIMSTTLHFTVVVIIMGPIHSCKRRTMTHMVLIAQCGRGVLQAPQKRKQKMGGVEFTETKRFFKVMMPGFNEKLNLPQTLYNKLAREKSEQAVLKSCLGTCKIKVCRNQELRLISFGDGWPDFVQLHNLCIGDFVVFEHIGNFHFNAFVFGANACEKDFFLVDPKEEPQEAPQSERVYFQVDPKEEPKEASKSNQSAESSGLSLLFESKNPFFNLKMNRRHVNVYVPVNFWRLNGLESKSHVFLRDPGGRKWPVRLCFDRNGRVRCRMGKGWHDFYVGNKLKLGDICGFELITNSSNNAAVMNVHIFPALS